MKTTNATASRTQAVEDASLLDKQLRTTAQVIPAHASYATSSGTLATSQ